MELRKVLIICPYFPPVNGADMQRVRMSIPYFADNGWVAEVVRVDEKYTDLDQDHLLLQSLPSNLIVHKVKALNKKWTSKIGLGSIALRSLWFYRQKVNQLLKQTKYDLIYFSTTQFPLCILGPYWKKRFGIPYVIDMQDAWHSDYYLDKPKAQRPSKYWFSYRLNKFLEPIAMKNAGGLISVSDDYISDLKKRYPVIKNIPASTITFGAFNMDLQIAAENNSTFTSLLNPHFTNVVYVGRGGADMHKAIIPVFEVLKNAVDRGLDKLKFYFIGTSYAPNGQGIATILPLAAQYGVADMVVEITGRISYYHTLATLQQADALFIPGSDDPKYTASKIYPYLLTQKPLLAIFNPASAAIKVLNEYGAEHVYDYNSITTDDIISFLLAVINETIKAPVYNPVAVSKYSSRQMAINQCLLFNTVINGKI